MQVKHALNRLWDKQGANAQRKDNKAIRSPPWLAGDDCLAPQLRLQLKSLTANGVNDNDALPTTPDDSSTGQTTPTEGKHSTEAREATEVPHKLRNDPRKEQRNEQRN